MSAATGVRPDEPALWPLLTTLRSRLSFRFSGTGRSAAALVADGRGFLYGEFWDLGAPRPVCRTVPGLRCTADDDGHDAVPYDAVPFDTGEVLVLSPGGLTLLTPDGGRRPVGRLPGKPAVVAPTPDGLGSVLFLTREHPREECRAWLWPGPDGLVSPLGTLPPLLARGGGWLDGTGRRYLVNVREADRTVPTVHDLRTRDRTALSVDSVSGCDTAWFTAPGDGEVLVATAGPYGHRLRSLRPGGRIRELTAPDRLSGTVTPVALHPAGGLVALQVADGAKVALVTLDTAADRIRPLPTPKPCALGAGAWCTGPSGAPRFWSLGIGAGLPARLVAHDPDGWSEVLDGTPAGEFTGWAPSRTERLPGAEGEIEAIICGHQDWRSAREVAICLHGGPADRWSLKFSQLFQVLADQGVTVIAPNPRGSTGYGTAFHQHIVDAWAGPDLADVLAVARHIHGTRGGRPLSLYGASYGAFLALLAAGISPQLWSRVAAIAPLLSGRRLYPEASPEVRAMIDRLGGRTVLVDRNGPRDALAQLPRLTSPLLIIHGERDQTIPASQSRRLVRELTRLGRRPGADFHYLEVTGAGHAPLDGSAELHQAVALFLAHGEWSPPPVPVHAGQREEVKRS
ncbi:alpha/beta hydrolase family protein [Streptomyces coffeae]|uniref:Alpha/beta fold hydrolase n=1 Tax=Streptomyces coffeae TaxID=621382 RepID=A0ABS1NLV0_9ACTN|nr:alpha/beta fold hydrolase [Streptomyces coffeae]MBL1101058.1 alpha/beta fold hydrolase [Streptomyces coffeae]